MTKAHPKEKDVKAGIKKILDKHGWFWWSPPANAYGRTGISDLHAIKNGVFMVIEAKLDVTKNPPTTMQKGFLGSIAAEAGLAFVVDADRLPILDAFLTAFAATKSHVILAMQQGQKVAQASEADHELMMNCIRSLGWEIITGDLQDDSK